MSTLQGRNVGKPPGKFIWKKLRHGEQSPIIYSDVSTTSTEIPDNCTFYGTSNLTIQLVKRYQMGNEKP
jgi:hypothetical protein